MTLVKAKLTNLDTNEAIDVMFNPPSYEFSKENTWAEQTTKGTDVPGFFEFGGGKSADLTIDLFFDTHTTGQDVRTQYTNKIWKLAMVNKDKVDANTGRSAPPPVEFQWGQTWSFKAVVVSVTQKFTLFLSDGTPTRADVKLRLRQIEAEGAYPGQNPTSGGTSGHRVHTVQERETLDIIAAKEYGHPRHWRHIAEANHIDDPRRLAPGMQLSLPPLGN